MVILLPYYVLFYLHIHITYVPYMNFLKIYCDFSNERINFDTVDSHPPFCNPYNADKRDTAIYLNPPESEVLLVSPRLQEQKQAKALLNVIQKEL